MQQKMVDSTGNNPGGIWVNPLMSVAHNYPMLVRKALVIASQRVDKIADESTRNMVEDQLCTYSTAIAKYVKIAASDHEVETYWQAIAKAI